MTNTMQGFYRFHYFDMQHTAGSSSARGCHRRLGCGDGAVFHHRAISACTPTFSVRLQLRKRVLRQQQPGREVTDVPRTVRPR